MPASHNQKSMNTAVVLAEHPAEGVGLIRINRTEARNALSMEVRELIARYVVEMSEDSAVRCIVLRGNEKVFASGADIREMAVLGTIDKLSHDARKKKYWRAITDCPKPVVAAVNGYALGGGCELAMSCDIIIAGESAKFGQPEVKIGVIPGSGGTQRFLRAVGKYKAMRYVLTGDVFDARQASDMGLVSEVVPDAEVEKYAVGMATRIAELSPLAIQQAKEAMLRGMDSPLETALVLEAKAGQILFSSMDQKEGANAFLEKRKPRFQGK